MSTTFLFEYELPPDHQEFDLELVKQALPNGMGARSISAPLRANMTAARVTDRHNNSNNSEETSYLPTPNVLLPLLGTAGGAILPGQDKSPGGRAKGGLRGLLTGLGAAGGQTLAGNLSGQDLGARIAGGGAGGLLAYLLANSLIKDSAVQEKQAVGANPLRIARALLTRPGSLPAALGNLEGLGLKARARAVQDIYKFLGSNNYMKVYSGSPVGGAGA